jgi:hypothetical protein
MAWVGASCHNDGWHKDISPLEGMQWFSCPVVAFVIGTLGDVCMGISRRKA